MSFGLVRRESPASLEDPLEQNLAELSKFGKPSVNLINGGWYCRVEMHIADGVKGATFDVKSEFGHAQPSTAVVECLSRAKECARKAGGLPK